MKRIHNIAPVLIALLLVLSALLRVWGFDYDLPYMYHPDEPSYIAISQRIFQTGDLNPHFFNYPSLFFYINALAYIPYHLAGKLLGIFHTPNDILPPISLAMGVSQAQMPTAVLWERAVTICFGVGCVGMVALALPVSKTFAGARLLTTVNSRETARVWIDDKLPSGAKIAIQSYAPFVDPSPF